MSEQLDKLAGLIVRSRCNTTFLEILHAQERLSLAKQSPDKMFAGLSVSVIEFEIQTLERLYRDMTARAGLPSMIDPPNRQPKPSKADHYIDREIPHNVGLPRGEFVEHAIAPRNRCDHGCKIYRNIKTDERVLAHNSAYGCNK